MAEIKNINILNAISSFGNYHTSVILTYGANLAFYEQVILSRIWQADCRNNLIFMDSDRYRETISEFGDTLGYIGRRYLVVPIKVGAFQSFHSKIILLLGSDRARLFVGSGNLTFNGYGDNLELFIQVDWSNEVQNYQIVVSDVWKIIIALQKRWGHFEQADLMLGKAEKESAWLEGESELTSDFRIISSLDAPLLDQLASHVGNQKVERITILSPFLDKKAKAVEKLHHTFNPKHIDLVLQNKKTCGDVKSLNKIRSAGVPLNFYGLKEEKRYLHAKLYGIEGKQETLLAIGSANCTQAGLLADSHSGNIETLLVLKFQAKETLQKILSKHISSQQIDLDDSVSLRPNVSMEERNKEPIDFQEIVLDDQTLVCRFYVQSLLGKIRELALRFSLPINLTIPIGQYSSGDNKIKLSLTDLEAQSLGNSICAATIYGSDIKGQKYLSLSNSLWLTNIGELNRRRNFLGIVDERAGRLLNEMHLGSAEDWRDLYNTISTLVEFETDRVRSFRPEAPTANNKISKRSLENDEHESRLRVVDRETEGTYEDSIIKAETSRNSTFISWLRIIFPQFPGEQKPDPDNVQRPSSSTGLPRHKPDPSISNSFSQLVRRYIRSLSNSDFTQSASPLYLISYFSIFQKIVSLLRQHGAIDKSKFDKFVSEIHGGFFGYFDDDIAPFVAPETRNHLMWGYHQLWRNNLTHLYALSSLVAMWELSTEQGIQALACICAHLKPSEILDDQAAVFRVADSYKMNREFLLKKLSKTIDRLLPKVLDKLEVWRTTSTLMLKDVENDEIKVQQNALVNICIAAERVAEHLNNKEQQISYCADIVLWASRLSNSTLSGEYQEKLVELYKEKGDLRSLAHALIHGGSEYRSEGDYAHAVKSFLQAKSIAMELNDKSLLKTIEIYLSAAKLGKEMDR